MHCSQDAAHAVRGKDPTAVTTGTLEGGARPLGASAGRGMEPMDGEICGGRGEGQRVLLYSR